MANEKWVADAREVLLDVERIYDDHYFMSNDQTVHDIFNAFRRIIRRHAAFRTVEVVHGRWVDRYGGKYANPVYDCSECRKTAPRRNTIDTLGNWQTEQYFANYCPNCGAKMDGD